MNDRPKSTQWFILTLTLWREARGESLAGKYAVAHAIKNRVDRPKWWGNTYLGVCVKKWQFSSLTDPHDPQLTTWPSDNVPSWDVCGKVAEEILEGTAPPPQFPGADSYYDLSIPPPSWSASTRFCGQIGRLLFFDVDHDYEIGALS